MSSVTYHPTGARLLVQRLKSLTKIGSIHLPDSAIQKPTEGIVIALGAEETRVLPSQHILFTEKAKPKIDPANDNLILVDYDDVVAIVNEDGSLTAGDKYTLAVRIYRKEKSSGGIIVPRRAQEETDAALIYDPGIKGRKEGLQKNDFVAVRPHCGIDFVVGDLAFTAFDMDNDEIFGIIEDAEYLDLDERNY